MAIFLILVFALGISGSSIFLMYKIVAAQTGGVTTSLERFQEELGTRKTLKRTIEDLYGQMGGVEDLCHKGKELIAVRDALKTERGRTTITQAELETIEARLRELDEIDRELGASNIDTQEEIRILEEKKKQLQEKNQHLKEQLHTSLSQIDQVMSELQMSAEMQQQVQNIKAESVDVQQKIDTLLTQIEMGNDQYFILKRRYDALDIEYAQLYEKFAAAEEAAEKGDKE